MCHLQANPTGTTSGPESKVGIIERDIFVVYFGSQGQFPKQPSIFFFSCG